MVYDNDYDHFNFDEKVIFIVNGRGFERIYKIIKTNNISDNKRQQTTTVDNKRLFSGFVLTGVASLRHKSYKKLQDMTVKKPFDKEHGAKISFSELVKLIDQKCDYKFAIIDYEVDDELKLMAKNAGINLDGYKHVIETSGTSHSEKRHGKNSNDRMPLSMEDYFLIPFTIKFRDSVIISPSSTRRHHNKVFIYEKKIGNQYVYVEEIRKGRNKSLAFQSLRKEKPPNRRL